MVEDLTSHPPKGSTSPWIRRGWIWGGIFYLILRWVLLAQPGYVWDVQAYKRWAVQGADYGISQIYRTSDMDYPPFYAYLLIPLGKIYQVLSPEAFREKQDSALLTVLIKLPPFLFDLAIAGVMVWFFRRSRSPSGGEGARRFYASGGGLGGASQLWPLILAGAYLLNPAVLFNHGYWGEPDSIHSFLILAAFLAFLVRAPASPLQSKPKSAVQRRRAGGAWPAWVLLSLATLMKPLGAPFFPLLLILSLLIYGRAATIVGILAAGAVSVLLFSPFLVAGQGSAALQRVLGDVVNVMPNTSSNAHNLWWLLGPWKNSEIPWLGPITATQFGLTLFGLVYLALLAKAIRLHRSQTGGLVPAQSLALAAAVGFSFFMLSTHMHENHMFVVLPLTLAFLPMDGYWRRFFIAVSVGIFLNLLLHDLDIPARWPFTLGGQTNVVNQHLHRPFFMVELICIWISTLFNLALYGFFLGDVLRPGNKGLLARLARASQRAREAR